MTEGSGGPQAPIRIHTLGRFNIESNCEPVRFGPKPPRKPLELLKVLIALGAESVSVELLCESVWPDADGDKARSSFTTTLARLRKILVPEALVLQDARLTLVSELCWTDAKEAAELLGSAIHCAGSGEGEAAGDLLDCALALYQGPFLDGEFDLAEVLSMRERLHELFLRGIEQVAGVHVQAGDHTRATGVYRQGLAVDDVVEVFYQGMMTCCRKSGHIAEGIAAFERCRNVLKAKYDIEPSEETRAVYQSLLDAQPQAPRPPPIVRETASSMEVNPQPPIPPTTVEKPSVASLPEVSWHTVPGERRIATVGFFDLHGYTEMNERLDPEDVERIMSRIKEEGVRIVESHGGMVNQFVGDEILALFGIPVAHEDDPVRAVRAGLEIAEAVERIGQEVEGTVLPICTKEKTQTSSMAGLGNHYLDRKKGGRAGEYFSRLENVPTELKHNVRENLGFLKFLPIKKEGIL